jgi:hypothetical protein
MANKALAKRQKLTIRIEPSQGASKPRNHVALAAKQRTGGAHQKSVSAQRQAEKRQLKNKLSEPEEQ